MDAAPKIRDWLVVALLMVTLLFSFIDRFVLALLTEPIKQSLNIDDGKLGLLSGVAFGIFYAAMGLPLGWLADRWSRKGTILLGVGIWTACTALSGFAGSFGQLLVARIGVGAGEAALAPASYGIIHDRFAKRYLSRAVSIFMVGGALGSGAAFLVGGFFYKLFLAGYGSSLPLLGALAAWQKTFIAVALPGVFLMLLLLLIKTPTRTRERAAHDDADRGSALAVLRADPAGHAMLFLGMACVVSTTYSLASWLPAILQREFSWTPAQVGASYGVIMLLVGTVGIVLGGVLTDWLLSRNVRGAHVAVAFSAAALAIPLIALLALADASSTLLIITTALQLVVVVPIGVVPALIQLQTPAAARGRISAVYVLTLNVVGLGIVPSLIGLISARSESLVYGLRGALVMVMIPVLGLGAALLGRSWVLAHRRN